VHLVMGENILEYKVKVNALSPIKNNSQEMEDNLSNKF